MVGMNMTAEGHGGMNVGKRGTKITVRLTQ